MVAGVKGITYSFDTDFGSAFIFFNISKSSVAHSAFPEQFSNLIFSHGLKWLVILCTFYKFQMMKKKQLWPTQLCQVS